MASAAFQLGCSCSADLHTDREGAARSLGERARGTDTRCSRVVAPRCFVSPSKGSRITESPVEKARWREERWPGVRAHLRVERPGGAERNATRCGPLARRREASGAGTTMVCGPQSPAERSSPTEKALQRVRTCQGLTVSMRRGIGACAAQPVHAAAGAVAGAAR